MFYKLNVAVNHFSHLRSSKWSVTEQIDDHQQWRDWGQVIPTVNTINVEIHIDKELKMKSANTRVHRFWPGGVFPVACTHEDGAGEDEEKRDEDGDGESTEDVNQHVWIAALPEDCAQHFSRIVPEHHIYSLMSSWMHLYFAIFYYMSSSLYPVINYWHCSKYRSSDPWCRTCYRHDNRQSGAFRRDAHKPLNTEKSWGQENNGDSFY